MNLNELTEEVKSRLDRSTQTGTSGDDIDTIVEVTAETIAEKGVEVENDGDNSSGYD